MKGKVISFLYFKFTSIICNIAFWKEKCQLKVSFLNGSGIKNYIHKYIILEIPVALAVWDGKSYPKCSSNEKWPPVKKAVSVVDLGDGQYSERCDVDGSFFNSDAITIIFGKA